MLQTLYISNFVLIDELQMDFNNGFSAFIGETGAGKSILMDAISLVCGERGSSDVVRHGANKAIIEASFDVNERVKAILDELGFDIEDMVTLTREISSEGKSVCRVNRRVVNLGVLKDIGNTLINQHSQFDTVSMKLNGSYISLLDKYMNRSDVLDDYENLYNEYLALLKEKDEFYKSSISEDELELIQFNVDEINNANIYETELDEIEEKMKLLQASEMIERVGNEAIELIDGDDGISDKLYNVSKVLRGAKGVDKFSSISEKLDEYYYEIKDLVNELNDVVSTVSSESENFELLQERAFLIRKLYRKYGGSYDSMMIRLNEYAKQIEQFGDIQGYEENLQKREKMLISSLENKANGIHNLRLEAAKKLEKALLVELADLNLKNASFKVEINKCELNKLGFDDVVFMVSMNKGELLRPLLKCASGGELSRFMLGLKVVFKDIDVVDTIIFDEIDSGISGATAYSVGQKMLMLSKSTQVFSVTHLAQVAASCDHLYFISKETNNDLTTSKIELMNDEKKYEKLALIATGTVSNTTITTAKEMVLTARGE